jgi:hypothetical protein
MRSSISVIVLAAFIAAALAAVSGLAFGADNLLPNPGFEQLDEHNWPVGWSIYNWGPEGSEGTVVLDSTVAHSGKSSVAGVNADGAARMGVYTHVPLKAGSYELSFWAKAEEGKTGFVRCYLGTAYSRQFPVADKWTKITYINTLLDGIDKTEINVQNSSGTPGRIWFDDISLVPTKTRAVELVPDPRPVAKQPKLLYFDANLMYWADHAAEWKARGFSGAFISGVFSDVHSDVWAADKDPKTRGEDDKLLQECKAANAKCRKAGIDSNVLKVAFYQDLPDPFDDVEYGKIATNFREAARFARMADFPCMAIDTEYTAYQFDPGWKGYDLKKHTADEYGAKWREQWRAIIAGVVREYPSVDLLVLPEGSVYYGRYWDDMFAGMIDALIAAKHKNGLHLFCEGSYQNRSPVGLQDVAEGVKETTVSLLPPRGAEVPRGAGVSPANAVAGETPAPRGVVSPRDWFKANGDVALGLWPLGYYRAINDANGKFLGWSGRKELFGDKIVGSYADKGPNYTLGEFRIQCAAAREYTGKYFWIYGHGSAWWQMTPEEDARYKKESLQGYPSANYLLPTVPDISEFYKIAASRQVLRFTGK